MPVIAKLSYLRVAPRKMRLVTNLIRGKTAEEAQTILTFTTKKAAQVLLKLLKQAIANAKNNFQLEEKNLYISKILVDEGPKYKRWMPRARGLTTPIQKKTSHLTIVLDEIVKKSSKKIKKMKEVEKIEEIEKIVKAEKPRFKPEIGTAKPKVEKGIKRVFRRKAF